MQNWANLYKRGICLKLLHKARPARLVQTAACAQNEGLRPRVIRRVVANCCRWCGKLAGTYTYPDVPQEVYQRHEYCRCTVEYDPGDGRRQNVHTKKWTDPNENVKVL